MSNNHVDVLIIGAGLSGIGAACHLTRKSPNRSYAIIERRERIGGTNSQRSDFDESRLAIEFTPSYVGLEKLGKFKVHHLKLSAKKDADVAYPVIELWVDVKTSNILKQQEKALSGRLMRTSYYPKWNKLYSESKGEHIYFPKEIRIFDEIEKGKNTLVVMRKVDLRALDANIFTKAWLESKSR